MLLLVEGFEGYGTTTGVNPQPSGIIARTYSNVVVEAAMFMQTGRLGGYCIQFGHPSCQIRPVFTSTHDTIIIGFAVKFSIISNQQFLKLYDGTEQGMSLRMSPSGEIIVLRATVELARSVSVLAVNTWYYIEFKVKTHQTLGTYEVRVGGVNVVSGSGADTQMTNPYYDGVQLSFTVGSGSYYIDDWYICDGSGADNNDFLGNCLVDAVFPDGDDTAGWAIASGGSSHYLDVDENPVDDDVSYVEDAVTGSKDLYDYAAMPAGRGLIKGISIKTVCRETDAENFDIIVPIKSGATEDDGPTLSIGSTDYVIKKRVSELDPNTSLAWTKTTLDAAKFGVKVG